MWRRPLDLGQRAVSCGGVLLIAATRDILQEKCPISCRPSSVPLGANIYDVLNMLQILTPRFSTCIFFGLLHIHMFAFDRNEFGFMLIRMFDLAHKLSSSNSSSSLQQSGQRHHIWDVSLEKERLRGRWELIVKEMSFWPKNMCNWVAKHGLTIMHQIDLLHGTDFV